MRSVLLTSEGLITNHVKVNLLKKLPHSLYIVSLLEYLVIQSCNLAKKLFDKNAEIDKQVISF